MTTMGSDLQKYHTTNENIINTLSVESWQGGQGADAPSKV